MYVKKLLQVSTANKKLKDVILKVVEDVESKHKKNPKEIMNFWYKIIQKEFASMTKPKKFENDALIVYVKNSTLYSVLVKYEKDKLLKKLQKKFSKEIIKNIIFRME